MSKHVPPPPVKPTRLPERAWQEVAADLLGPLPTGEYLLVVVDYFSRWMEVDVLRSTTSATIIKCLDSHFARYGVPVGLRTDNGSNLAPVVQRVDNAIHRINHYPVDSLVCFPNTYPPDSDLSGG